MMWNLLIGTWGLKHFAQSWDQESVSEESVKNIEEKMKSSYMSFPVQV